MGGPFFIGIDDTDSRRSMCTTYLGAVLHERLSGVREGRLVRLNPNNPWKTRGNAAVCLKLDGKGTSKIKGLVVETVEELADLSERNTNPGIVFFQGEPPDEFTEFYWKTLHGLVEIQEADDLVLSYCGETVKFKNGRGIVGSLASIGADLTGDHTYEIITYRPKERWGTEREVDEGSVMEMDRATRPLTFNNVHDGRVLITPNTPCPILYGIRGEDPDAVRRARSMVRSEEVERELVFRTNQGTDAHLRKVSRVSQAMPYSSVILEGKVDTHPEFKKGGHLFFSLTDGDGSIDCAAYEPTKGFRFTVEKLVPGDRIRVYGGVRKNGTVNLERLDVLELMVLEEQNPLCDTCGKRMESAGVGQGFRCRPCKTKKKEKEIVRVERDLAPGAYQVPPGSMRHLSKPLSRFIREDNRSGGA